MEFFYSWNEWIIFFVKYSDFLRNVIFSLIIWDIYGINKFIFVGSIVIFLFGKRG